MWWNSAVIAISLAAFIFNTSEFVPIGLLSLIAKDFGVSEAEAGFLISHSDWCEVESQGCFDLHFPDD